MTSKRKHKASEPVYIPSSVSIMGQDVPVLLVESLNCKSHAEFDGNAELIRISEASPHNRQKLLLHESIHAALYLAGLSDLIDDEKLEEAIVMCLETALHKYVEFK